MNNKRRKEIEKISNQITELLGGLQVIQEEEQEAFDNLPEGIQESEKGEVIEENADNIQSVIDEIESQLTELEEL